MRKPEREMIHFDRQAWTTIRWITIHESIAFTGERYHSAFFDDGLEDGLAQCMILLRARHCLELCWFLGHDMLKA